MQHFCPVSQGWKYLFPHDWLPAILKKESLGKSSHRSPRGCCQSLAFCFPPSLSGSTSAKSGPPLFPLSISVISGDRSHGAGSKRSISWQSASPAKWSALFFRASVIAVFLVHLGHHDNTASAPPGEGGWGRHADMTQLVSVLQNTRYQEKAGKRGQPQLPGLLQALPFSQCSVVVVLC